MDLAEWRRGLSRGDYLVLGGGLVTLLAALLPWYKGFGNAFGDGLFPVATFPFVCALGVAGRQLLRALTEVKLPPALGPFSWPQIDFFLAGYAALTGVCFLVMDAQGASRGIGLYLDALAGLALLGGVLEQQRERRASASRR